LADEVEKMLSDDIDEGIPVLGRRNWLLLLGLVFVFVGIAVIIVATAVLGSSGSVGGVILIGPFPIVFGAGSESSWLIAVGAALSIISLALFFILNRRAKRLNH
jgi:LPXTG-motif cell wall-anchored protein